MPAWEALRPFSLSTFRGERAGSPRGGFTTSQEQVRDLGTRRCWRSSLKAQNLSCLGFLVKVFDQTPSNTQHLGLRGGAAAAMETSHVIFCELTKNNLMDFMKS